MSKRRPYPKRLFRGQRLPAEVARVVDEMAGGDPRLRSAICAAAESLVSDTFLKTMAMIGRHERAEMLLGWQEAVGALHAGRPCDFCPAAAAEIRTLLVGPDGNLSGMEARGKNAAIVFAIACRRCAAMNEIECQRRMLGILAARQATGGVVPDRRPAIVGQRVGEATAVPSHRSLQDCTGCGATVWINQDQADDAAGDRPLFVCRDCAREGLGDGRLEAVPDFFGPVLDLVRDVP